MSDPRFPTFQGKWYQGYFPKKGVRGEHGLTRIITANGKPLRHIVFHTDAPMTWGDSSAESADLALSILINYLQPRGFRGPLRTVEIDEREVLVNRKTEPALSLYKRFLREVVSHWPSDKEWIYTEAELMLWMQDKVLPIAGKE